jgi:hypothetical protein
MALDNDRLKQKIKAAFKAEQSEEEDSDASLDRIAQKISDALIDEVKQMKITYTNGLVSPNGAVTGVFNATIT